MSAPRWSETLIFFTSAQMPLISTASPTWMGRSKSRMMPLIKLLKMFCRPNPSPMPRAPKATVREVELTPKAFSASQYPGTPHQVNRDAGHRMLQAGFQAASRQHPVGQHVAAQSNQQMGEKQDQGGCKKAHQGEAGSTETDGKAQNVSRPEKTAWVPLHARTMVTTSTTPHSSQQS